jgi:hypothetical protein
LDHQTADRQDLGSQLTHASGEVILPYVKSNSQGFGLLLTLFII